MKCFLTMLCALLALCGPACAVPPPLLVVLVPGSSLTDWIHADAPHLHQIMAQGALAVMNTRTARLPSDHLREPPDSAVLTLGAGARAAVTTTPAFLPPEDVVLSPNVTAAKLHTRRMGIAPLQGAWVCPEWPRLLRDNTGRGYDIRPGNLGDALAASHVTFTAGGGRFSDLVACRSDGTVVHTSSYRQAQCVIWDAGSNLASADAFLGNVMQYVQKQQGHLLIVSPFASDSAYANGRRLTPIALWGAGVSPGLLVSDSTHRAGLVTNTDFAPSLAAYFGATLPVSAFGRPWHPQAAGYAVMQVSQLEAQAYDQSSGMRILPTLAVTLGGYLLLATLMLFARKGGPRLALFPLIWVCAVLISTSATQCLMWLAVMTIGSLRRRQTDDVRMLVVFLTGAIVVLLTGDMLFHDSWMHRVLLGYSAVEGARYYGIGNEAMGALIGAALVLATAVWTRFGAVSRPGIAAGLLCITVLLGAPSAGAKAGSILVAVPSFGVLLWQFGGKRLDKKAILCLGGLAVVAMAAIVFVDLHHPGAQTHVGAAFLRIQHGGLAEGGDIILRKLTVEAHLLYHSTWAVPLWAGLAGIVLMPIGKTSHSLTALRSAGLTAIICSLAFNDAGTIAAALCAAVVWSALLLDAQMEIPHSTTKREAGDASARAEV